MVRFSQVTAAAVLSVPFLVNASVLPRQNNPLPPDPKQFPPACAGICQSVFDIFVADPNCPLDVTCLCSAKVTGPLFACGECSNGADPTNFPLTKDALIKQYSDDCAANGAPIGGTGPSSIGAPSAPVSAPVSEVSSGPSSMISSGTTTTKSGSTPGSPATGKPGSGSTTTGTGTAAGGTSTGSAGSGSGSGGSGSGSGSSGSGGSGSNSGALTTTWSMFGAAVVAVAFGAGSFF